jgi:hypothetical protein
MNTSIIFYSKAQPKRISPALTQLKYPSRYIRHIQYNHYKPYKPYLVLKPLDKHKLLKVLIAGNCIGPNRDYTAYGESRSNACWIKLDAIGGDRTHMSRSTRQFACGIAVLIITFSQLYPASAAVWDQTDARNISTPLFFGEVTHSSPSNKPANQASIAASHDASETKARDFMQQITRSAYSPINTLLGTDNASMPQSSDLQTMHLIGQGPTIRGNGTNQLPMDATWLACCGDGTVLAAIDSSYHTIVNNTQEQRPRRTASLVSMAKTGTALPLSFEVSRRVRAQSVPEPTSVTVLGLGSLLLLRRRSRRRHA